MFTMTKQSQAYLRALISRGSASQEHFARGFVHNPLARRSISKSMLLLEVMAPSTSAAVAHARSLRLPRLQGLGLADRSHTPKLYFALRAEPF